MIHLALNKKEGLDFAKQTLYNILDSNTSLFLSGGRTPKELYESLAKEKKLTASAVSLVDERFGERFHENSNEKMIQETGLLAYFTSKHIPFYPILSENLSLKQTAEKYNDNVQKLFTKFQKSVGVLGIGLDGHTAGLPTGAPGVQSYGTEISNFPGEFKERITMTFLGLSKLDMLLVLVFGEDKRKALELMFQEGSIEEIPARFYKRLDIAKKTLLITDQKI